MANAETDGATKEEAYSRIEMYLEEICDELFSTEVSRNRLMETFCKMYVN